MENQVTNRNVDIKLSENDVFRITFSRYVITFSRYVLNGKNQLRLLNSIILLSTTTLS
jgi:hypothetical protein